MLRTFPLSSAPMAVNALLSPARKITLYGPGAFSLSQRFVAESACKGDSGNLHLRRQSL